MTDTEKFMELVKTAAAVEPGKDTIVQAYREGFAERLAELGIEPDALYAKCAGIDVPGFIKNLPEDALKLAVPILLSTPWLLGWGGGYMLGDTRQYGKPDIRAITDDQRAANYEDAIRQLRTIRAKAEQGKKRNATIGGGDVVYGLV